MAAPLSFELPRVEHQFGRSVSIEQAAQLMSVSRRTVYNRIREGRLQTIRTLGGSQRVLLDSLQELLGCRPQVVPTSTPPTLTFNARLAARA